MSKVRGGTVAKVTFGKRSTGKSRKSYNKHDRKSRVYRGQGR